MMDYINRPLEFRAYYMPTKRLFYVDFFGPNYVFVQTTLVPYPRAECVLMQFTGLYDSQGKKVFEGDILYSYYAAHGRDKSSEYWRVIVYREGCFCEFSRIDEELTIYNYEPVNCDQDRIVNCYYLRPDLLDLNQKYGNIPLSFD